MTTATDPQLAAMLAAIDAEPDNPDPVAVLGDWFEDHGDVRAGCIQWAMRWGRMPRYMIECGYYFITTSGGGCKYEVLHQFNTDLANIPHHDVFFASQAWLALCDRWAEMTADEREVVTKRAEELWGTVQQHSEGKTDESVASL